MTCPTLLRWTRRSLMRLGTAAALGLGLASTTLVATPALAQTSPAAWSKLARDLQSVLSAPTTPAINWAKDINGARHVKVLVMATPSSETELTDLRAAVLGAGGTVFYRYMSVHALLVILPAAKVADIAARSDVQAISPNRATAKTVSHLEYASGVMGVRVPASSGFASGLNGSGVGIAVLDSGIAWANATFVDAAGKTRVKSAVDVQRAGDAVLGGGKSWNLGVDYAATITPGSKSQLALESLIKTTGSTAADLYGHGSHVASVAAGIGFGLAPDATGLAPGANLYDVQVLDAKGMGQMSDVLIGIDWVLYHAKEYNIRVINLSLAADSTESWQTDPLARAARSAVAAGITVVAAAGNFGVSASGAERYGTVSSPGHDPSVITVGAANTCGTAARSDDSVNFFSSRGPNRGASTDANGNRSADNLLKPDLVAPGNRIVGAMATDKGGAGTLPRYLGTTYPALPAGSGLAQQTAGKTLMTMSGTSVAAPVVAGAAALLLQANPGLTPPLIKAILQYSAQPLPGASLLQQGAGLLNIEGAVRLAQALPAPVSTLNGQAFNWSRVATVGGNQLVSGNALFTKFQPVYDHRLTWARNLARRSSIVYWPAAGEVAANTFVKAVADMPPDNQALVTPGVVAASGLLGSSSYLGSTGAFTPTATLSGWLASGSGSGLILSEGLILSQDLILGEGFILSESGQPGAPNPNNQSLLGEP